MNRVLEFYSLVLFSQSTYIYNMLPQSRGLKIMIHNTGNWLQICLTSNEKSIYSKVLPLNPLESKTDPLFRPPI